jgi:hypothetical protein
VLDPVRRLAEKVGGIKALAALAERSPKSVYRWGWASSAGGNDGFIPLPAQRRIVANAERQGLAVTFNDFTPQSAAA